MTARERELWNALKDAREALCAAMRVVAREQSDRLQTAFITEVHAAGVQDGFGARIDHILLKFAPTRDDSRLH